jgi:hypothetical protein
VADIPIPRFLRDAGSDAVSVCGQLECKVKFRHLSAVSVC